MKNKTKLILGLTALTAVTAGAATTSTLAWFTTTRTASVQFTSIGIYGSTGDLGIELTKPTNGFSVDVPTKTSNSYTFSSTIANALTDISGNGSKFYRPIWKPGHDGEAASDIKVATNGDPAGTYYYIQFILKLTNSSTANPLNVYFQNTIAITSTGTNNSGAAANNKRAAHSARVAMYNFGETTTTAIATDAAYTKVFYDGTDTTSTKYLSATSSTDDTAYGVSKFEEETAITLTSISGIGAGDTEPTNKTTDTSFVTTINASKTNYVGFSIWLEGQSASCKNDANEDPRLEKLAVTLPLVGFSTI